MKKWWIGCSGFHYDPWRGPFYPDDLPKRRWFEFYCEHFNTVELNVTFYRFPKPAALRSWYQRSPEEFRFTVKAPRLITHFKRFNHVKDELNYFYDTVADGLDDKLGTVLFQLHPRMAYSEENLEKILSVLDSGFQNVIEFRDESWWNNNVLSTLKRERVTFCGISYPKLPDEVYKTAPIVYYRFHGVPQLYRSSYSKRKLQQVSDDLKRLRGVNDVYTYFNNDIDVAAVRNAKTLQQLVGERRSVLKS
jgi:uncharacterized protein YecE (DUF72 family)